MQPRDWLMVDHTVDSQVCCDDYAVNTVMDTSQMLSSEIRTVSACLRKLVIVEIFFSTAGRAQPG